MITHERAKECLDYNPDTGEFRWKSVAGKTNAYAGKSAGNLDPSGYVTIKVDYRKYPAHRLAFLIVNGEFPPELTDHINGVKNDNRWSNLRFADNSLNQRNAKISSRNTSGVPGVCFNKRKGKWVARIMTQDGIRKSLGYFNTICEAAEARRAAEKENGYHENYGRDA